MLLDITVFLTLFSLLVLILSAASSASSNKKLPVSQVQAVSHSFLSVMSLQLFVEVKISQVSLDLNYISIQWNKKAVQTAKTSLFKMEFAEGTLKRSLLYK